MPCARQAANSRIVPILAKSMLPVPRIFSISPSDSAVVAFPRIFGPATLNTVEHAAQIITIKIAILYFPMYWASCFAYYFQRRSNIAKLRRKAVFALIHIYADPHHGTRRGHLCEYAAYLHPAADYVIDPFYFASRMAHFLYRAAHRNRAPRGYLAYLIRGRVILMCRSQKLNAGLQM